MNGTTLALCAMGYEGNLCSVCSKNADARDWVEGYWDEGDWVDAPDQYTRSISECKPCEKRSRAFKSTALTILGVLLVIYGIVHWIKNSQMRDHQLMLAVLRLLPDLLVDLKVFVGLYQVLTGMSQTLLIEYPPAVVFFSMNTRIRQHRLLLYPRDRLPNRHERIHEVLGDDDLPWDRSSRLVYQAEEKPRLEGVATRSCAAEELEEAQTEAKKKHRHTFDEKTNE